MKIAPYDQLTTDNMKLDKILDQYDIKLLDYAEASSGIENKTIITNTNRGKYVIRVYRYGKKTDQSINVELDFMRYLRGHNIPIPGVLRNTSGQYITTLPFDNRIWQIVVMKFAEGEHASTYTDKLLSEMAKIQATMHALSSSYNTKDLPTKELKMLKETYFIKQVNFDRLNNTQLRDFVRREKSYTLNLDSNLPKGLCHLDYDKENLLSKNSSIVAVLDFDDLAIAPFVVCLAYTLWHVYAENSTDAARQYLTNYEAIRQLSDLERKYIKPIMLYRHYMISALKVLNNHTTTSDIKKYLDTERQLLA